MTGLITEATERVVFKVGPQIAFRTDGDRQWDWVENAKPRATSVLSGLAWLEAQPLLIFLEIKRHIEPNGE